MMTADTRSALDALRVHADKLSSTRISALFDGNSRRFEELSFRLDDLLLDLSKCRITSETLTLLRGLAQGSGLIEKREAMFAGAAINITEHRAALHVALRDPDPAPLLVDGRDIRGDITREKTRAYRFAADIRSGLLKGATGKAFTDIVNIGIGGSDLGPAMVCGALASLHDGPRCHFVSNVDGAHLRDVLKLCPLETTLFIVASKTITTIETMTNARTARALVVAAMGEAAVADHFLAVSTALEKVAAFGIRPERIFGFWDWVGGRYSVWSVIGLPVMIAVGPEAFERFLSGAHAMDRHFRHAPLDANLPVQLALLGIWHRIIMGYSARAIIPYAQRLARFPAYLQQLDMESNGKSVMLSGDAVSTPTGPLVWGEPGTNGQHAFFQLLHQGTDIIPVEFLLTAEGEDDPAYAAHQPLLIANCLAQSQALMKGRSLAEAGGNPHRVFAGDRPSITLLFKRLDPYSLGRLIALYEHRVFVEAVIFGINPFDQWGVELGKELATRLEHPVKTGEGLEGMDGSTAGLVRMIRTSKN